MEERHERFETFRHARLAALAYSFPSLKRRIPAALFMPWDAERFARHCAPMSGGEKDAALFVLSVWNPEIDWARFGLVRGPEHDPTRGRFDVHRALGNWDYAHRKAFAAWALAPWWL